MINNLSATTFTSADLLPLLPELVLAGAAFGLLLLDLFLGRERRVVTHVLAIVALPPLSTCWINGGTYRVRYSFTIRDASRRRAGSSSPSSRLHDG